MARPKSEDPKRALTLRLRASVLALFADDKAARGALEALAEERYGFGLKLVPSVPHLWPSGAVIEPDHREDPGPKLTLGSRVTFGARQAGYGERLKKPKGK